MSLYRAIQNAVNSTIHQHRYQMSLPPVDNLSLRRILSSDTPNVDVENDRLEFLGDAIIHATIGRLVFRHAPEGYPYLYTKCSHVLWSNETFCKLAEAMDIWSNYTPDISYALNRRTFGSSSRAGYKTRNEIKHTADLFETILGAYYLQSGFEALGIWVDMTFWPLAYAAIDAYWNNFRLAYPRRLYRDFNYGPPGGVTKRYRSASPVRRAVPDRVKSSRRHSENLLVGRSRCWPENEKAQARRIAADSRLAPNRYVVAGSRNSLSRSAVTQPSGPFNRPAAIASPPEVIDLTRSPSPSRVSLDLTRSSSPLIMDLTHSLPSTPTSAASDKTLVNNSPSSSTGPLSEPNYIDLTMIDDSPTPHHPKNSDIGPTSPTPILRGRPASKKDEHNHKFSTFHETGPGYTLTQMQVSDFEFDSDDDEIEAYPDNLNDTSFRYFLHPIPSSPTHWSRDAPAQLKIFD